MLSSFKEQYQYIVDEKGNPTAVIIPIEEYKNILATIEKVKEQKETKILSESEEFKKLLQKGLDDIRSGRIKHWEDVWSEL